jgi:hypothetical protein
MKYVSDKFIEKFEIHILSSITFFENRVVYKKTWKYFVKRRRSQMKICGMGTACWIPRATNTHSGLGYVIIIAFALQQCFHEGASNLHYTLFINLL